MNKIDMHAIPTGWLTEPEAVLLLRYAEQTTGTILEVGCYRGRSSVLMASLGRPMICVDPFAGFCEEDMDGEIAKNAFLDATKRFNFITLEAIPIEKWKPLPCGFAYLDGDHTYSGTLSQIRAAQDAGASLVAVHDVNDTGGGVAVKDACIDMLGHWVERVERLAVFEVQS